jgi:hypothetical protein
VRVHRVEKHQVALRVEARDELGAVMRQIGLDGERLSFAREAREPALELRRRPVREHADHPRDREPGLGTGRLDRAALDVAPADRPGGVRDRSAEDRGGPCAVGERRDELERDHASEGSAGDEREGGDAERRKKILYEVCLISRRNGCPRDGRFLPSKKFL